MTTDPFSDPVSPASVALAVAGVNLILFLLLFDLSRMRRGHASILVGPWSLPALLVLLFLSAFSGQAHASDYADQGAAYADCVAHRAGAAARAGWAEDMSQCNPASTVSYSCYAMDAYLNPRACRYVAGLGGNPADSIYAWPAGKGCGSRPEITGMTGANTVCYNGCTYYKYNDPAVGEYYSTLDDSTNSIGGVCTTADSPEPVPDADGDGVPDDLDAFPNDPNESADSDGDGIGDNADIAPGDPNNGEDQGEGNETDNSATGGGDCNAPPTCSGDGIACNTNWQLWKTRCAVEGLGGKVTGSPGNCNAAYTCEGNAVQCAQVHLLRQQICGTGSGDGGEGNGAVGGTGDCGAPYVCSGDPIGCASLREQWLMRCSMVGDGDGDDDFGEDRDPADYIGVSESESEALEGVDFNGWLGRGSCPWASASILSELPMPAIAVQGGCTTLDVVYWFVMIMTALHVGSILGRSMTGGD